jgi:peptide/nickel transport system substrate-binding protein
MSKIFVSIVALALLVSCGSSDAEVNDGSDSNAGRATKNGSKYIYGGVLKIAQNERFVTLFPADVEDAISSKMVSQIHDGLVKFSTKDLSILNSIADNWTVDESQTIYTFTLRDNVYFHNDPCFTEGKGRKVIASDFKYSFELMTSKETSQNTHLFKDRIVGASDYLEGKASEISGIQAIDENTLKITIVKPQSSFIYLLALPNSVVIAHEAFDKYGNKMTVGAGAFKYVKPTSDSDLYLSYNENYYLKDEEGNQLPYLDSVIFTYVPTKLSELEMFRTKDISFIYGLPTSRIAEVVADNIANFKNKPPQTILIREPEMITQYYEFNAQVPPFDNLKVRKALNYAVDRERLINNILNGQGTIGDKGITPMIKPFGDYDFNAINGYGYNPELARQLLKEAGYPNGEGFPSVRLEINLGGNIHKLVATELQYQFFDVLGIHVEVEQVSFADKVEHSKYGKSEMFRSAWVADYPSPESFLSVFYGENVPATLDEPSNLNTMRYKNEMFDSLFVKGTQTANKAERYAYFAKAEGIMMEESPVIILWYQENYTLYHSEVRNFYYNAMEYFDFSGVYMKEVTREEVKAAQDKLQSGDPASGF